MTTNEIIKEILNRHIDVIGYVVNTDNIKSIYMYNDDTVPDDLDENYLIFYEIHGLKYVEIGTMYRYCDNDGYGREDLGLNFMTKKQYVYNKITTEIKNQILKIQPYILDYHEFENDDDDYDNTDKPDLIYKKNGRKYCEFNNDTYIKLPIDIIMELIDIMIQND
jgi:hypothetical protein